MRQHRRGAAAVEFAVVAPLFFLLVMGAVEIGRTLYIKHALVTASNHAARLAAVEHDATGAPPTQAALQALAQNWAVNDLARAGIAKKAPRVTVNTQLKDTKGNLLPEKEQGVSVSITLDYNDVALFPPWFMKGAALSGESTYRLERIQ